LNANKTFQLLDIARELKMLKTKDKKVIDYFPRSIINNYRKNNILNEMIIKKKEFMNKGCKENNNDNLDDIEFI
jgi:hypothetical protein